MDYVEELISSLEKRTEIDKFDALMSILSDRVRNAIYKETKESVDPLHKQLMRGFYSLYKPSMKLDVVYNDPVAIEELSDVQKAYICGQLSAMQSVVAGTLHERPSAEELKYGRDHVNDLKLIGSWEEVEYDPMFHGKMYQHGLIFTIMHGDKRVCVLTPLGKDIVREDSRGVL